MYVFTYFFSHFFYILPPLCISHVVSLPITLHSWLHWFSVIAHPFPPTSFKCVTLHLVLGLHLICHSSLKTATWSQLNQKPSLSTIFIVIIIFVLLTKTASETLGKEDIETGRGIEISESRKRAEVKHFHCIWRRLYCVFQLHKENHVLLLCPKVQSVSKLALMCSL